MDCLMVLLSQKGAVGLHLLSRQKEENEQTIVTQKLKLYEVKFTLYNLIRYEKWKERKKKERMAIPNSQRSN